MAYGTTNFRDDWLHHAHGTTQAASASLLENLMPHDFVGAQVGYEGSLVNHGEFCWRSQLTNVATNTLNRYLHAHQSKDDAAPVEVTGAFAIDQQQENYQLTAGLTTKVPLSGHAEGTVLCPAPSTLVDDDYVDLPDGTVTVRFWIDKSGTNPRSWDATNVRWLIQGMTTAIEVADELRSLVKAATNLNLTTDLDGSATVVVMNRAMDYRDTPITNVAITASAPFTVSGMAGGSRQTATVQGYTLSLLPSWSGGSRIALSSGGLTATVTQCYNQVAAVTKQKWIGLKLTAHRVGDSMRLRGYYMAGKAAVDQMYINPTWIQVLDLIHMAGTATPVAGSVISGQTMGSLGTTVPSYTGRSGFFFRTDTNYTHRAYAAGLRIRRGVPG